ncbi:MAG TPA: hypothetical protein VGU25_08490 [Acidobacteriaceae bacterium]|nr:hypothetical protein [Acidobacteriaceae bacterium]
MTKAHLLLMLPLLLSPLSHAQSPLTERQVIAYSKSIDVQTLDPSLPSQRLEDWLRSGPPHVTLLDWLSDDTCDLKPFGPDDFPRCIRISFGRGGQSGYFLVQIGTLHKGIIGPPHLYSDIGVQEPFFIQTGWTDRLSGLPHLLDQPVVAGGVNDLYQQIVQRHPIGIPAGPDKTALWPFLSRRLIQKLETARACQEDYLHQHPDADAGPRPAWLDTGIFVGSSKRAIPLSAFAVHKEPQRDGSFDVTVNLTYVKLPGFVPDEANWEIVATVIPENNRFVVDDVRLFDGLGTEGPSHLLTQTLTGCNGTHWTGEHAANQAPPPLPGPHYTDWDAVNALRDATNNEELAFAKAIDVHLLDPSVPSQRLADWLTSLHVNHIEWRSLGCNIKEGLQGPNGEYAVARNPDGGLCAWVWFQRGNARASIKVHSPGKGTTASATTASIFVRDKDDGLLTTFNDNRDEVPDSNTLSDLPRLLDEEAVIDVTRNLYDAIVARHPLGIPRGQDMMKISPLLSKSLRAQLQTAQACHDDYLRQHPRRENLPEPRWFNAGLFTGDSKLAAPKAALADHKERQQNGSFQVRVWLSRDDIAPKSSSAALQWRTSHVSALVKSEQARFVLDDIRLFAGDSADSPSHLLSESFAGCDGRHWVGVNNMTE